MWKTQSILVSFIAVFAAVAAHAEASTLYGSCAVTQTRSGETRAYAFAVKPGEKLELGIPVESFGERFVYVAEAINNVDTEFAPIWGEAGIGFTRPKNLFIVRNPPELCPTQPRDLECEARNAALAIPDPASDAFHPAADLSDHGLADILMPHSYVHRIDGAQARIERSFEAGEVRAVCQATLLF